MKTRDQHPSTLPSRARPVSCFLNPESAFRISCLDAAERRSVISRRSAATSIMGPTLSVTRRRSVVAPQLEVFDPLAGDKDVGRP